MIRFTHAMADVAAFVGTVVLGADAARAETVIYNGAAVKVDHPLVEKGDLWVKADDLQRN